MAPRPTKKTKTAHPSSKQQEQQQQEAVVVTPGGDDLEDNLLLEDEYLSDGVQLEDVQGYLSPEEETRIGSSSRKRSASEEEEEEEENPPSTSTSKTSKTSQEKKAAKKDKSKQKKKAKLTELGVGDEDNNQVDDTAMLPVEVLLDRLSEKQLKALPNLSRLELDEIRLNQSMIQDTSSVTTRDDLLAFMKEALPTACTTLGKLPKAKGSPRILVVSGAALRVADLCRQVKNFRVKLKDDNLIDVGKLFAKHFKLNEHAEYLDKTFVGIAVGTPNRIEKLLNETDSLKLTHLSHLILDTTHLDQKKRSLMDLPDARGDLFKLLGCQKIMDRLKEGKMKLVLF
ncbi:hypothetical protein JCM5350_001093 [Sporobolomyces pararoseus]